MDGNAGDARQRHGLRGRRQPLGAVAAGLGPFLAAALVSGALYDAPPMPARVEAAVAPDRVVTAAPPVPRLCFHGTGGEFLDLAPAGQPCP